MDKKRLDSILRKIEIKAFYKETGTVPSQHSKEKHERYLGVDLRNYTAPSCHSYDLSFREWFLSIYAPQKHDSDIRRSRIKQFYKKNRHLPSLSSKKTSERRLAFCLRNYCIVSNKSYNPTFAKWIAEIRNN